MKIIKKMSMLLVPVVFLIMLNVLPISASKPGPYIVEYTETPSTGTVFNDYLNTNKNISGGVFCVKETGTLNLREITFSSNTAFGYGGAIGNYGNTIIKNGVFFSSNTAFSGGAIQNYGKTTINPEAFFYSNSACYGGAIRNIENLEISSNVVFMKNKTLDLVEEKDNNETVKIDGIGGAIYNDGYISIGSNTNFQENSSNCGGAIYNSTGTITIERNTKFIENKAYYSGGAIQNYGNTIIKIGVSFSSNVALIGGAIYNSGEITISSTIIFGYGTNFSYNVAESSGGAIYNSTGTIKIGNGTEFINNSSIKLENDLVVKKGYGGAIYNISTGTIIIGSDVFFSSNTAFSGGAIQNYGKTTINPDTFFYSNSACYGGAIRNIGNLEISSNVVFMKNKTLDLVEKKGNDEMVQIDGVGGAIYNDGYISIGSNTNFQENSSNCGGAIYNSTGTIITGIDVIFIKNNASSSGGAIYNEKGKITIDSNANFKENSSNFGGAIYDALGEITIGSNANFDSNSSSCGGAIYNEKGKITIDSNVNFKENSSVFGGVVYNTSGTITIGSNANFDSNSSSYGGAIYSTSGTITVGSNANFKENSSNFGGVVHNTTGTIKIGTNITFTKNKAICYGGAIYNSTGTIEIGKNVNFIENESGNYGGVIYNNDYGKVIIDSNVFFRDNRSESGGAIYNSSYIEIGTGTIFSGNYTYGNYGQHGGGAIQNYSGIITINPDVSFIENESANFGGAICNNYNNKYNKGYIRIRENALFKENKAIHSGGAIYNEGYIYIENGVIFDGNCSYGSYNNYGGGAIQNYNGSITIGSDVSFNENVSSNFGGAISNAESEGTITIGEKALFKNNKAMRSGGAIYNNGKFNINSGTKFENNETKSYGGTLCNDYDGVCTIYGAKFFNNQAKGEGGAIYNNGILNLIADKNIEFVGNKQYVETEKEESNAIYNNGTINLYNNRANIIFNDKIIGSGDLYINKKGYYIGEGKIVLNADMSGYKGETYFYGGTIELGKNGTLFNNCISNIEVTNATINMANGRVANTNFKEVTINSRLNLTIDADLNNKTMDMLCFQQQINGNGKINVKEINIIEDSNEATRIDFANIDYKNKIITVNEANSILYKYNAKLEYGKLLSDVNGYYYVFSKSGINSLSAVSAIASSISGYAVQSQIIEQSFLDIDTKISNRYDFSKKQHNDFNSHNLYASIGNQIFEFENDNNLERSLWLRPFALQETVNINDIDVDNTLYGTLAGIDYPIGQTEQISFYLGYVESKQEFDEIKTNQTGYILGLTGIFIKESWYLGITFNGMFNKVSDDEKNGISDFDMKLFTIGTKAGYDYYINEKWTLEPNITVMYGIVNSNSYETNLGSIGSQSTKNISILPQLKVKLFLLESWQPYGLLGYSANLSENPTVKAGDQKLKLDSIDGYLEYGLGVNKDFTDTEWSCYAQITAKSGGRNGFAGNLGIKYKF